MERPLVKACFWIAAGPEVGGGHAVRAEALATSLSAEGIESTLFASDVAAVERACMGRLAVEPLGSEDFSGTCRRVRPDLAVIDLPHSAPADEAVLRGVREAGALRLAFDASDPGARGCEILVSAIGVSSSDAESGARHLLGPEYAIVRDSFRTAGVKRRVRSASDEGDPLRLLVAFGASDPRGLTHTALTALASLRDRVILDVLIGPLVAASVERRIEEAAARFPDVCLHRKVQDPSELMLAADVCVTSFGILALEAAATGLPTVLWHTSEAHAEISRRFAWSLSEPIAIDLGAADAASAAAFVDATSSLLGDFERRRALSRAARWAVDGRGAERVAKAARAGLEV